MLTTHSFQKTQAKDKNYFKTISIKFVSGRAYLVSGKYLYISGKTGI